MNKELTFSVFRINMASEFKLLSLSKSNRIVIKRKKGTVVMLSEDAFNDIEKAIQLYSNKNFSKK